MNVQNTFLTVWLVCYCCTNTPVLGEKGDKWRNVHCPKKIWQVQCWSIFGLLPSPPSLRWPTCTLANRTGVIPASLRTIVYTLSRPFPETWTCIGPSQTTKSLLVETDKPSYEGVSTSLGIMLMLIHYKDLWLTSHVYVRSRLSLSTNSRVTALS